MATKKTTTKTTAKSTQDADGNVKSTGKGLSAEDRQALNDKARYDYGIMNADQMDEKQLNQEMKQIDDQIKDGQKENAAAEKAAKENA